MISEKLISKYIYINKNLENEMIEMKNIDTVETIDTIINSVDIIGILKCFLLTHF